LINLSKELRKHSNGYCGILIERDDPTNSTSLQAKWVNSKIRVALVSNVLQLFDQPSTVPDHLGNMGWNNNMATQEAGLRRIRGETGDIPLGQC